MNPPSQAKDGQPREGEPEGRHDGPSEGPPESSEAKEPRGAGRPADAKQPWREYLRRKGLKTTQQREAIVDAFLRSKGHVALDDLLASARKRNASVGLATVYRTVKLLEEAGLAHSRQFGSGHTLYEVAGQRAHHDHLICQQCNHIIEFENEEIEALQERVAHRFGFNITRHRHEIFGLCEKAQGVPGGFCPAEKLKKR